MEKKNDMNIILAVIICLILVGVLIFISINKKTNMNSNNDIGAGNTDSNAISANTNGTSDNTAQTGQVVKKGDTVSMYYTGRLSDGTVFDSNVDPKFGHTNPLIFTIGAGQVIPGWDKGIVGMKVGEKKTLTIAPADAYGAEGVTDPQSGKVIIPPNATLVFDVELIGIKQ